MSWNSGFVRIGFRFAIVIAALVGLFVFPWGMVVAGILIAMTAFQWYGETLGVGFIASVLAGEASWKCVLVLGSALIAVEIAKAAWGPRRWFSYAPIAVIAAGVFGLAFFAVV